MIDGPRLTEEEISDIVCRYPEDTDFIAYSVEDACDAQLRKALWWLHGQMVKNGGLEASSASYWRYCAENVGYWIEIEGVEPWEANHE